MILCGRIARDPSLNGRTHIQVFGLGRPLASNDPLPSTVARSVRDRSRIDRRRLLSGAPDHFRPAKRHNGNRISQRACSVERPSFKPYGFLEAATATATPGTGRQEAISSVPPHLFTASASRIMQSSRHCGGCLGGADVPTFR